MKKTIPRVSSFKSGAKLGKFKMEKGALIFHRGTLKRVHQGREFYPINFLAGLYNSVSMAYALPCGEKIWIPGGLSLERKVRRIFLSIRAEEEAQL